MSAEYCDECKAGESSLVMQSLEEKKKRNCHSCLSLISDKTASKKYQVRTSKNLSLLNHSNLFLSMPKIYIFHKLLQGILQWIGLRMIPIMFLATPSLWRCTHTSWQKNDNNCRKFTINRSLVLPGDTPKKEGFFSIYFTLVTFFPTVLQCFLLDEIPLRVKLIELL